MAHKLLSAAPPEATARDLVSAAKNLCCGNVPVDAKEWAAKQARAKQDAAAAAEAARVAALQAIADDAQSDADDARQGEPTGSEANGPEGNVVCCCLPCSHLSA